VTGGFSKALLTTCALAMVAGCAVPPVKKDADIVSVRPPDRTQEVPRDGAIFHDSTSMSLFEDVRAKRVGDILTVILAEKTDAKKEATTSTAKDTNVDMGNPTILGGALNFNAPRPLPKRDMTLETNVTTAQKFSGQGDSSQSNSLTGNVTVTVVEVLSNGNLVVRGEKTLRINQGDEYLRVAGVVRPADISSDNSVISTQLADAHIDYSGSGFVADSNKMGWFARFVNAWWPF
jgi:flagellar L-ring protein precursor FlgH